MKHLKACYCLVDEQDIAFEHPKACFGTRRLTNFDLMLWFSDEEWQ